MKCPKCGNELKRSQKNPEYVLCYNCKKKFKYAEENVQKPDAKPSSKPDAKSSAKPTAKPVNQKATNQKPVQKVETNEPYSYAEPPKKKRKQPWYTKTWFVILMFIFFWPVALFLMWKYKKGWHKVVKILLTVLYILSAISTVIGVIKIYPYIESMITKTDIGDGSNYIDPDIDNLHFEAETFTVSYSRHEVNTDWEGNLCLVYYFTFTNNGEEAVSAVDASYVQCFQNGEECLTTILDQELEEYDNYALEIAPGDSIEACEIFSLEDTSEVIIQTFDWTSISDERDTQILSLE